jgi:hypothetical protein
MCELLHIVKIGHAKPKKYIKRDFCAFFKISLFNTASSAAPQIGGCWDCHPLTIGIGSQAL